MTTKTHNLIGRAYMTPTSILQVENVISDYKGDIIMWKVLFSTKPLESGLTMKSTIDHLNSSNSIRIKKSELHKTLILAQLKNEIPWRLN